MEAKPYLQEINTPSRPLMEPTQPKPAAKRILAIDTLRGFDMLMITGAGTFVYLLHGKTSIAWIDALALQFEHPAWNGFTFYDFIFPLFLFIAGVSMPFSLNKGLDQGLSKSQLYKKAFVRMLILIGLGIIDKNAPVPFFDWQQIRFVGVLQRIGFAGFIATVLYLNFNSKQRIFWIAGILLFYYTVMFLIPVPGFGAGDLSIEGNLHGWIDRHFLPGRLLQKIYDENGLLTQLPALCLTVMGTLAGDVFRNETISDQVKLRTLLLTGAGCVLAGLVWGLHFPINKHLWSSSFIMLTGGMAFLSLGIFYWIIDILKYQRWTFFFIVIGMNSLTIYMAYRLIDFGHTSQLLFEGLYSWTEEKWHPVFESLGALAIVWFFLYTLYRLKIFWKV
jgi:predicted acyltransferase